MLSGCKLKSCHEADVVGSIASCVVPMLMGWEDFHKGVLSSVSYFIPALYLLYTYFISTLQWNYYSMNEGVE
jgi:hypothetical protein